MILVMSAALLIVGCGSGDDNGDTSSKNSNSIDGTYFSAGTRNGTNDFFYSSLTLDGNKVTAVSVLFPESNPSVAYTRAQEGTFTVDGDIFKVDWDYETCNPEGTAEVRVTYEDPSDRIFVQLNNVTAQFLNEDKYGGDDDYRNTSFTIVEDVDCDRFPE